MLKIILDCDDVLYSTNEFTSLACRIWMNVTGDPNVKREDGMHRYPFFLYFFWCIIHSLPP